MSVPVRPRPFKRLSYMLPAAVCVAIMIQASQSPAEDHANRSPFQDKTTQAECGNCHMAYPAALLSAKSWRAIMSDLPNHFGEDASLDEATRKHIEDYLVSNTRWPSQDITLLRISEQAWFKRRHHHETGNVMFQKAKSWSNCHVCHGKEPPKTFKGFAD